MPVEDLGPVAAEKVEAVVAGLEGLVADWKALIAAEYSVAGRAANPDELVKGAVGFETPEAFLDLVLLDWKSEVY